MNTVPLPKRSERAASRLAASPVFLAGCALLGFWIICALFGQHFEPWSPYADDITNSLAPPSVQHWFGTDQLGRDVFSRILAGARDILIVAPLVTLLATLFGTALGIAAGYFGGWIDLLLSRLFEVVMAVPLVILALVALAALGSSRVAVIAVITFGFTPMIARTVRSAARGQCALDYVAAAQMRGESLWRIMFVEVLPNIAPVILVEATLRLGYAVFSTATLSFLGFGIQPPSPDWGLAIAENYPLLVGGMWWTVLFDALATASLVIGTHLVAEGLHRELGE
jgi:peptide/nickel transport system permease protein